MNKYENVHRQGNRRIFRFLIIILIFIFLICFAALLLIKFKVSPRLPELKGVKLSLNESLNKQLENQSGEKEIQLNVTESDLGTLLKANEANFPLKNPTAKITEKGIILTGKTSDSILSVRPEVTLIPKVADGKIKLEAKEIKVSGVSAPKTVSEAVASKLDPYLSQPIQLNNVTAKDVKLFDKHMVVYGERK